MKHGKEFEATYTQLRHVASGYLRSTGPITLQTTALVHEAYLKLAARPEDPPSAQILELAYFGGYRQGEIAETLGVSDRTVRTRIAEARDSLRRILDGPEPSLR